MKRFLLVAAIVLAGASGAGAQITKPPPGKLVVRPVAQVTIPTMSFAGMLENARYSITLQRVTLSAVGDAPTMEAGTHASGAWDRSSVIVIGSDANAPPAAGNYRITFTLAGTTRAGQMLFKLNGVDTTCSVAPLAPGQTASCSASVTTKGERIFGELMIPDGNAGLFVRVPEVTVARMP